MTLLKKEKKKQAKYAEKLNEHRATNVIRMLTRLLFVWFLKEKKLIPEELFELDALQKDILNKIEPYHQNGFLTELNKESVYYKAILQNLFFATLNCPIKGYNFDTRERGFRGEGYGTHRGIDYLMRYKQYFKDPDAFLKKVNGVVPFLNGGLFECLDDKFNNVYIDGFSDNMTKGEMLIVPDYLFFGVEEITDLSDIIGIDNRRYKQAAVKGLINILKSYKFTVTENTPIEEDVALDPELLGKVFENLLATYNPETKTTARKQTGSFYTPREIVNYMVDESLQSYLKQKLVSEARMKPEDAEIGLEFLVGYNEKNHLFDDEQTAVLINAIDNCKILDPACGSGAFPMGILHKLVHVLHKLDPNNKLWKERQIKKAEAIDDPGIREKLIEDIKTSFENNELDYGRKLYLIENCIYGVDIQPIATQISKLRFFISLIVDQKIDKTKDNFGIRPLPNLETKFVAANTLIGIEKESGLFFTEDIQELEKKLKAIRSKLFNARTKETKNKYRKKDEELRTEIAKILKNNGLPVDSAEKLATWDPYDQNASSPFFDPEWMFDIEDGFDVVIGNPPYVNIEKISEHNKTYFLQKYGKDGKLGKRYDVYQVFILAAISNLMGKESTLSFILPNTFLMGSSYSILRENMYKLARPFQIVDLPQKVFENATVDNVLLFLTMNKSIKAISINKLQTKGDYRKIIDHQWDTSFKIDFKELTPPFYKINVHADPSKKQIFTLMEQNCIRLGDVTESSQGIIIYKTKADAEANLYTSEFPKPGWKKLLRGTNIGLYQIKFSDEYLNYGDWLWSQRKEKFFSSKKILLQAMRNKSLNKRLIGVLDNEGYYNAHNLANIIEKKNSKFKLEFIISLFNSTLINYWYKNHYPNVNINPNDFRNIPIKETVKSILYQQLSSILHYLTPNIGSFIKFYEILDALVFNLYFPDHMKERNIDVLDFVEQDINEVMQGRDFEQLNDSEKEKIIEVLHKKWSDPENEVVKRMALFKERSPEILKPILES